MLMNTRHLLRHSARLTTALGALVLAQTACAAASEHERACDIHAAAMVAEMKASSTEPLSATEIALVRRTAFKSCVAQPGAEAVDAAPAPVPAPTHEAAAAASAAGTGGEPDKSLWSSFERLLKQDVKNTPGAQRLRRRSGSY